MSANKLHVRKGDKVAVISGAWKSDEPREVLDVDVEGGRVTVADVNMRYKHEKKSPQNPQGGRIHKEFPIDASNVLMWSDKAGKGVRTHIERVDGKAIRVGTCGTRFD